MADLGVEPKSDDGGIDLNDLFGEKIEVDPLLKSLAEAQDDTPAEELAEGLTDLLHELEDMMAD